MSQKPKFPKTAIRRSMPRKRVNFLTVRANCDFEQTMFKKQRPPRCYPLVSRRLGLAYQYAEARRGNGVAVGVCALGVVLGVVAHVCEAAQIGSRSVWRVCSQLRSCSDRGRMRRAYQGGKYTIYI